MYDPIDRLPDAPILERSPKSLMYLGQTFKDRQIWLDRDDMTRHLLVAGSTGSGKTELLLGMCANSLASGNGVMFVDGKGDIATFAKVYALATKFGRQDDVLLLNFSQGIPVGKKVDRFLSNTLNPLLDLSADAIVQILTSLMEDAGGDNAMWKGRAIAMLTGVVRAAAWLRDSGAIELGISELRDLCSLRRIIDLANPRHYPDMPSPIRTAIRSYLNALPGYQEDKKEKQSQTTMDQHGYLEMQTTRLFSSLADVYGHIFGDGTSHIDMKDVVLNRRILVVLLPVLEKSSDEVANLGRIVVALLKNMMSIAMAAPVEGTWSTVVEKRPTNAEYPFLVIMDEASHYLTDGMAMMAGQARSLGFCLVFAVQDIGAMEERSRKETKAIMANTNTKIYMNMQNPNDFSFQQNLPSNERHMSARSDQEDLLRDRIMCISDRARAADPVERRALLKEMRALYDEKLRLSEEDPYWRLGPAIKRLGMGEFVLVRQGEFLRGRALYVSKTLDQPDISLAHPVSWGFDPEEIRGHYEREARKRVFLDTLVTDPAKAVGAAPLTFAVVYQDKPGKTAKASIRRAFATISAYNQLTSIPVVKATSKILVLGD